jgi:hypothetical protein
MPTSTAAAHASLDVVACGITYGGDNVTTVTGVTGVTV